MAVKVAGLTLLGAVATVTIGKKADSQDYSNIPMSEKEMFGSKSLRCLVCKAVVEEFSTAIGSVPPDKKVEIGSFKLQADGKRESKLVNMIRAHVVCIMRMCLLFWKE